jgi:hypothetical protein
MEKNKQGDDYMPIYSLKLAGFLMLKGFVLKKITPNRLYPEKNVFWFNDGDELRLSIEEYKTAETVNIR